jgi:glycosyltransferase involved in cell wall biosynthesis
VSPWGSDLLITGVANVMQAARARFVLSRATAVIADGENLAAAARRLGGDDRVHMVPWGIDVGAFRAAPARVPGLILSTRMHEAVYDLPTVFRGVREALTEVPEARLVVAGSGSLTAELERLARATLPAGRFEFVGRLTPAAMADWLGRAEFVVSASRSDSTSQSLLEAMASGAVPIVSDIEGNRAWVRDGVGTRTFKPGDSGGLARALALVRHDPEWAERARRLNRERVERDGDAARNMQRIESLFASLAALPR